MSELKGLYLQFKLNKFVHVYNHGIDRDDPVILLFRRGQGHNIRKTVFKFFKDLGCEIEGEINSNVVQYLDIELALTNESVSPIQDPLAS